MADHNPSQQTASKAQGPTSTEHHAYDAPNISAKEFLLRVMHAPDVPIKDRIRAASSLLRLFPHDWDPPQLKYVIGGIPSSCARAAGLGTPSQDPDFSADGKNRNQQSFLSDRSYNHYPRDRAQGPSNIETNTEPLSFDDIQQIKAAVQRLHPDADLSQVPDHLTLCECGHWMLFPCKCASIN